MLSLSDNRANDIINRRERILAQHIADVCSELRLIDVVDLVVLIKTERHANIDDLISSSAELFFKPDTLKYGYASEVDLTWGGVPSVAFDMEFRNQGVTVFFSLSLGSLKAGVDIHQILFEDSDAGPEGNDRRLKAALEDAMVKR